MESGGHYNWIFLAYVPGLWLSTIYGGFHYAIDSILGVGIGTFAALFCHYMVPPWLDRFNNQVQMSPAESQANASPGSSNECCGAPDAEL
jgi:membrane-associated phospholipid phosphatase